MKKYLNYLHHQLRRMKKEKHERNFLRVPVISYQMVMGQMDRKTYIVEGHFCSINHFGGRVVYAY